LNENKKPSKVFEKLIATEVENNLKLEPYRQTNMISEHHAEILNNTERERERERDHCRALSSLITDRRREAYVSREGGVA
jgi:hypothetical protein